MDGACDLGPYAAAQKNNFSRQFQEAEPSGQKPREMRFDNHRFSKDMLFFMLPKILVLKNVQ